jgi:putative inorganic carbon (hco3(-)) transporter
MRSFAQERTLPSAGLQAALVVGCGLALAWLIVSQPMPLLFAALGGLALIIIFLQRPDLGLLLTLIIRASSDTLIGRMSGAGGSGIATRLLTSPNAGLVLLVILGGTVYLLNHRSRILSLPGAVSLVFLLLVGTIGLIRTPSFTSGLDRWFADWSALIVYALTVAIFWKPQQIQRVVNIFAVAFIAPATFGLYQLVSKQGCRVDEANLLRICGTFIHPNPFAFFLVIMISVFLCQALVQRGGRKLLALSIVATAAILLISTQTRVGWAGALIVLLTVGVVRNRRVLFLVPLLVVAAMLFLPSFQQRVTDPFSETGGSLGSRRDIWNTGVANWLVATSDDSPFVTVLNRIAGTGPDSVSAFTGGLAAHNDYLYMFLEYGALGLAAFVLMLISLVISTYRIWRRTTDPDMKAVALSFFALTLAFPVMHLTDNLIGRTQNQLYFWTLAGLTAAIGQMTIRAKQSVPSAPGQMRLMETRPAQQPEDRSEPRGTDPASGGRIRPRGAATTL